MSAEIIQLFVTEYTPKSFILYGEDTKKYKDTIRNILKGKWNGNLKHGPVQQAWIFPLKQMTTVKEWIKNPNNINIIDNQQQQQQQDDGTICEEQKKKYLSNQFNISIDDLINSAALVSKLQADEAATDDDHHENGGDDDDADDEHDTENEEEVEEAEIYHPLFSELMKRCTCGKNTRKICDEFGECLHCKGYIGYFSKEIFKNDKLHIDESRVDLQTEIRNQCLSRQEAFRKGIKFEMSKDQDDDDNEVVHDIPLVYHPVFSEMVKGCDCGGGGSRILCDEFGMCPTCEGYIGYYSKDVFLLKDNEFDTVLYQTLVEECPIEFQNNLKKQCLTKQDAFKKNIKFQKSN